jgi:hypothetical protein
LLDLYVSCGEGCPHCAAQQPFLAELAARHPGLVIHSHEVWLSDADHALIGTLARIQDIEAGVVPTVFVGGACLLLTEGGSTAADRALSGAAIGAGAATSAATGGNPISGAILAGAAGAAAGVVTDGGEVDLGKPIWRR